jgi:primosomal protein N' (replication factor Y)
VLVQTLAPEARAIVHASRHDSDGFLDEELKRREALGYPPFASLIRLVCSSPEAQEAGAVANALRQKLSAPGTVLGPAPLFRLRGRAREQILVKAKERSAAIAAVAAAVNAIAAEASRRGVNLSVDVDPQ